MVLSIDEGEFVVILGQSGAGKSTVLNMLSDMDQPSEGTVTVAGRVVSSMNDKQLGSYRADVIGFIFQFYNLLPSLTAYENIALVKSIVKNAGNADELLKLVGLTHCRDKFPSQMSGGEQQRVFITRALAGTFTEVVPRAGKDSYSGNSSGQFLFSGRIRKLDMVEILKGAE